MAKINEIDITSLTFQEGSAPTTPASTKWKIYTKTDGLYVVDDAGTETGPLGTGGGGGGAISGTLAGRIAQMGATIFHTLDETAGTTVVDDRGSLDSTYVGSPTLNATGIVDSVGCPDFDGTDDVIRLNGSIDSGGRSATVYLVVEPDALSGKQCLFKIGGGTNGYTMYLDGANLAASVHGSSTVNTTVTGSTTLSINTVYHVSAVFHRGYVAVFVNGALDGVATTAGVLTNNLATGVDDGTVGAAADAAAAGTRFGDNTTSATAYFDGKISHFAWWLDMLPDWQMAAMYDGTVL